MDRISRKGCVSKFLCCMAQKPVARKKAMKILDATAAVDRECDELQSLLTWDIKNVKPKTEDVRQAKKDGILPHVASVMGLCIASSLPLTPSAFPSPKQRKESWYGGTTSRTTVDTEQYSQNKEHQLQISWRQVSAYTQVDLSEALLRLLEKPMPTSVDWTTAQPKDRNNGIRLKNRWISLREKPMRSPMGRIAVGKEARRSAPQRSTENHNHFLLRWCERRQDG